VPFHRLAHFLNGENMETKVCKACLTEKSIFDFGVNGKHNGGRKSKCKLCLATYLRELRLANVEKARKRDRDWAHKNRDKIRIKNGKRYENISLEKKIRFLLKTAASRKNIRFDLTEEDLMSLWEKQNGICPYTNLPLTPRGNQINTVSLDRIDSNGDYEPNNVQLVCVAINRMKLDHTEKVFIQLCRLVTQSNKDKEYLSNLAVTV